MARRKPALPISKLGQQAEGAECTAEASVESPESSPAKSPTDVEDSKGTDLREDSPESIDDDDEDIPDLSPEELCKQGQKLEALQQHDEAVQYFEWAVRKKFIELSKEEESSVTELDPRMAEYWLRYGDAVFTRLEATEDLFNVEKGGCEAEEGDSDDDKKLAWDTMDTARVCFDQALMKEGFPAAQNEKLDDLVGWLEKKVQQGEGAQPLWELRTASLDEATMQTLKLVRYCRMRLGDFKMAFSLYEEAVEEFGAALQICQSYGLEYSRGLEVALPFAQCLMATQSPASVTVFRACLRLIEDEKKFQHPDDARVQLLTATYEDLEQQLAEYEANKEQLRERVQEAIQHVQGGGGAVLAEDVAVDHPAGGVITNLGVISKRRRKDEISSTQASQCENSNDTAPHAPAPAAAASDGAEPGVAAPAPAAAAAGGSVEAGLP